MQKLTYKGQDLTVSCSKSDGCTCPLCSLCKAAIETLGEALVMVCENKSREHYNFLVLNTDALFDAAREYLEEDETTVH